MSMFQLFLERPIENSTLIAFTLVGFFRVAQMVLKLFSNTQQLQAGNQAIITQDNTLQSKLIEFIGNLQKEMVDRRHSDEKFRRELLALVDETMSKIDKTTLRIDGTTSATSEEVKAIMLMLKRFDKGIGYIYKQLKAKGLL